MLIVRVLEAMALQIQWETLWPLEALAAGPNYYFVHSKSISHALGILWLAMARRSGQNIRGKP